MAKLQIHPGQEAAFGKKIREIVKSKPRNGQDVTNDLKEYVETLGGKIKVYIDDKPGITKIVVPARADLERTLRKLKAPQKEEYLSSLGLSIMRRCN